MKQKRRNGHILIHLMKDSVQMMFVGKERMLRLLISKKKRSDYKIMLNIDALIT